MDLDACRRLQALARARKTSVADLIREALRAKIPLPEPEKPPIVEAILAMRLELPKWDQLREEVDRGHAGAS
jgi:Ribbon-helix-helix protein, copG family